MTDPNDDKSSAFQKWLKSPERAAWVKKNEGRDKSKHYAMPVTAPDKDGKRGWLIDWYDDNRGWRGQAFRYAEAELLKLYPGIVVEK